VQVKVKISDFSPLLLLSLAWIHTVRGFKNREVTFAVTHWLIG
jgi:hypothetical protein